LNIKFYLAPPPSNFSEGIPFNFLARPTATLLMIRVGHDLLSISPNSTQPRPTVAYRPTRYPDLSSLFARSRLKTIDSSLVLSLFSFSASSMKSTFSLTSSVTSWSAIFRFLIHHLFAPVSSSLLSLGYYHFFFSRFFFLSNRRTFFFLKKVQPSMQ